MIDVTSPLLMVGSVEEDLCGPDGCALAPGHPGMVGLEPDHDGGSLRIAIITGSTRSARVSPQVAEYILRLATSRAEASYEVVDLNDFSLPLYDEPSPAVMSSDYATPEAKRWSQVIDSFDGFVLITPEYNRGVTASLKNAIDYLYPEFVDKAAGIVTYGSSGGTSAGRALREILVTLQLATVQAQPTFNLFTDFKDMAVFTPNPVHEASVVSMFSQVEKWARALSSVRVEAG